MSRTSDLLKSKFKTNSKKLVEKRISISVRRGTGFSGEEIFEEEPERIESYIKEKYIKNIRDRKTAKEAVDSLRKDSRKGRIANKDFENLLSGAKTSGRKKFENYLFKKAQEKRVKIVESSTVRLKSGERAGFKLNSRVYLIPIQGKYKKYFQARSFKTGRATKLPKNYVKKL